MYAIIAPTHVRDGARQGIDAWDDTIAMPGTEHRDAEKHLFLNETPHEFATFNQYAMRQWSSTVIHGSTQWPWSAKIM